MPEERISSTQLAYKLAQEVENLRTHLPQNPDGCDFAIPAPCDYLVNLISMLPDTPTGNTIFDLVKIMGEASDGKFKGFDISISTTPEGTGVVKLSNKEHLAHLAFTQEGSSKNTYITTPPGDFVTFLNEDQTDLLESHLFVTDKMRAYEQKQTAWDETQRLAMLGFFIFAAKNSPAMMPEPKAA